MTMLKMTTGTVTDRIETRRASRKSEACKVWSTLVRRVASDGRDLTEKDLSALEDAAEEIGIEDVSETFTADIEELKRFELLERESVDSHSRCQKLQSQAIRATAEVKRLQETEIPRLQREAADARAAISSVTANAMAAEKIRKTNVRLFPDG